MISNVVKINDSNKLSELSDLCPYYNLFIKPIARVSITVQIPLLHDTSGKLKSFTTWEIIEKLRQLCPGLLASPTTIKVASTTLEFVRFIAELEYKSDVKRVVTSLESQFIKLSGFPQSLRVRASEAPFDCPRRHDWESFFRDAKNMDETKSGERPDTLVVSGLPVRWFASLVGDSKSNSSECNYRNEVATQDFDDLIDLPVEDRPRLEIVKKVFEFFGKVRQIDIPILDPVQTPSYFEHLMDPESTIIATSSAPISIGDLGGFGKIGPDTIGLLNANATSTVASSSSCPTSQYSSSSMSLTFTAYVQYMDFTGFSRAMESLRGHKLVYAPNQHNDSSQKLYFAADIKIDFDKTKHLSKQSIQLRQVKRSQFLLAAERRRAEAKRIAQANLERQQLFEDSERRAVKRKEAEDLAAETERLAKKSARAEAKRQEAIERCKNVKDDLIRKRIQLEDRRRIVALRKVQAIRLMTYLLAKIQFRHDSTVHMRKMARLSKLEKRTSTKRPHPLNSPSPQTTSCPVQSADTTVLELTPKAVSELDMCSKWMNQDPDQCLEQLLKKREEILRKTLIEKRILTNRNQATQKHRLPG